MEEIIDWLNEYGVTISYKGKVIKIKSWVAYLPFMVLIALLIKFIK